MACGCSKGSGAVKAPARAQSVRPQARGVNSPGYTWTGRRNGPEAQPRAQQPKSG